MNLKEKIVILMIVVAMFAMTFVGCGRSSGLVGTWELRDEVITFSRNGTGTLDTTRVFAVAGGLQQRQVQLDFTWEVSGSTVVIRISDIDRVYSASFEVVGDSLIIDVARMLLNGGGYSIRSGTWTRQ